MKTPTILVVEDNPITRKMLLVALATEGYAVLEAPDGGTALELAERNPPDLILQDLMLPDMDGFELVEKLRKLPGGAEIPILACSGFVSRIEAVRTASAGFNDFVAKPVEPSRLMAVIRSYLPHPPASLEKLGRGRRLLLADDDPVQLKLGRLRLGELGFQVTTAANGVEALELARESPPDIIVSDVLMPQMDGFRLCVAVRQDPRLARVPVVLVSSNYIQESDRELARNLGASAYTLRTPGLEELIEALRSLDEGAPVPQVSAELLEEHLNERVRQQLEHQVAMNAGLMQRLSLQASMLSIVAGLSRALAHPLDIKGSLGELLDVVLDAVGVSLGVLYLVGPEGDLCFEGQRGYSGPHTEGLQACFGYRDF